MNIQMFFLLLLFCFGLEISKENKMVEIGVKQPCHHKINQAINQKLK